jgi:diketogulonate reductase-like aldo/keto reductase
MKTVMDTYTLANGVKMPKIGFGTWQIPNGDAAYNAVRLALKHGYRHIDTAEGYQNEESVGRAIKDSGIPRKDIWITTKLESHIKTYEGALEAFEKSLKELNVDYIDLFIIHAPWPWSEIGKDCSEGNVLAYKAMEKVYKEGKVRAIGVSNFQPKEIQNILDHCDVVPLVNQIGFFIGNNQQETHEFCKARNILIEAYSPLAIGHALSNETIQKMASKYTVSPAQICIRYCIEKGTAPLPKSTHESRIIENTKVDFIINKEDMAILDAIKDDPRRW